jgi:hypothetical protein
MPIPLFLPRQARACLLPIISLSRSRRDHDHPAVCPVPGRNEFIIGDQTVGSQTVMFDNNTVAIVKTDGGNIVRPMINTESQVEHTNDRHPVPNIGLQLRERTGKRRGPQSCCPRITFQVHRQSTAEFRDKNFCSDLVQVSRTSPKCKNAREGRGATGRLALFEKWDTIDIMPSLLQIGPNGVEPYSPACRQTACYQQDRSKDKKRPPPRNALSAAHRLIQHHLPYRDAALHQEDEQHDQQGDDQQTGEKADGIPSRLK